MPTRKKRFEVEVEVTEQQPVEAEGLEVDTEPLLVTRTEPEAESTKPAEESPTPSQIFGPLAPEPPPANRKLFWILIVVFAFLGAAAAGAGIYLQSRGRSTPAVPTPTPQVVAAPTPTPTEELNREDLTIQILNGSGVIGAAAGARDYLEELGYGVEAVGNASSTDFSATQISVKDSKSNYLPLLRKDLAGKYTLADNKETLPEGAQYDVSIVLGQE